jgi:nicotinic acid phosphoribosyltransferase
MEDDIAKVSNDYYYYTDKYDRRMLNIIHRFDSKTNKLYIDLRNRENDYRRLNKKVEYLYNYLKMCYSPVITQSIKNIGVSDIKGIEDISDSSDSDDEYTYIYMLAFLKAYTLFVIWMLINTL